MHLLDNVPHCDQLSCLLPHKQQLLLHCISSRVPVHEHKGGGEEKEMPIWISMARMRQKGGGRGNW